VLYLQAIALWRLYRQSLDKPSGSGAVSTSPNAPFLLATPAALSSWLHFFDLAHNPSGAAWRVVVVTAAWAVFSFSAALLDRLSSTGGSQSRSHLLFLAVLASAASGVGTWMLFDAAMVHIASQ